jgi:hypothetical protein
MMTNVVYFGAKVDPDGGPPEVRKFSSRKEAENAGFDTVIFRWDQDEKTREEALLAINVEMAKLSEKH